MTRAKRRAGYILSGLAFTFLTFVSYAEVQPAQTCVPPPPGMVSWWPGDGNANDIVDGNHGTLQNGATFAPGQVGQAFSFDGVDDYVEVASSPTLQFGTGDFTIDFWARILDPFVNAHALVTTQPVATDPPGILIHSRGIAPPANTVLFDMRDGVNTQTLTVPVPTDLQFHHFAFTRSGTDIKGYVDGVDQTTVVNAVGVANMNSPANLLFGRNGLSTSAGHYFAGQLDELEIYHRALSASEIQAIYNAGSAGKCKDADGDGVPDTTDQCPNSNISPTVVIAGCDSGVPNTVFLNGCTISDRIAQCAAAAQNHGQFVSCVAHLTNELKRAGVITGQQKGAIQSCAAQANIP